MPGAAFRFVATAIVVVALAGCSSLGERDRAAVDRPPELLSAGALALPADCPAVPGAVYRAEYRVGTSGAVEQVTQAEGPMCLQAALGDWVRTFRYAPSRAPASTTLDWMIIVENK